MPNLTSVIECGAPSVHQHEGLILMEVNEVEIKQFYCANESGSLCEVNCFNCQLKQSGS